MKELSFIVGWLIVFGVFVDLWHTTIHVSGSGFMTRRLNYLVWRMVPRRDRALHMAGSLITLVTVITWFILFWLGWCLVFLAGDPAVVSDSNGSPANLPSLIYYVGFSIITLGVGDYTAASPLWQILTIVASASGFFVVTLVITYLLPLVSAVVAQRQIAAYIHSLGMTPKEILETTWNGDDYSQLTAHLNAIAPMLHQQAYQHFAYPILHYYRAHGRYAAIAPAVAALDEVLTLLEHGVETAQRPPRSALQPSRKAVTALLHTLGIAYVSPAKAPPPQVRPHLELPDAIEKRRCLLAGWLLDQGWQWRGSENEGS